MANVLPASSAAAVRIIATAALAALAACSGSDEILPTDDGADGSGGSSGGHDAAVDPTEAPEPDTATTDIEPDEDVTVETDGEVGASDTEPFDEAAPDPDLNACGGNGALTFGDEPASLGDGCGCGGVLVCDGDDDDLLRCNVAPCAPGESCAEVEGALACVPAPSEDCENGTDDDGDGRVDCDDDECAGAPACERLTFQLSWSGAADLDIRLRHQNGCWADERWAVSFQNVRPDWGSDGTAALDIDDLGGGGTGVENIVLTGPSDVVSYHASVFNTRGGTATATLRVFVGAAAVFELSRALGPADVQWDVATWMADAAAEVDVVHAAEVTTCE